MGLVSRGVSLNIGAFGAFGEHFPQDTEGSEDTDQDTEDSDFTH
jgi:hypothetical protein